MSFFNTLDQNLTSVVNGDPRLRQHTRSFSKLRAFAPGTRAAKENAAKSGTLNDRGIVEVGRDYVKKSVAFDLRQAIIRHRDATNKLAERRAALAKPAIDKTDIVGALMRRELREQFRGMDDASKTARLTIAPHPDVVAAVLEDTTGLLTGVSDTVREAMVSAHLETSAADEVAMLRREAEVLGIVGMALEAVQKDVRAELGLSKDEFENWLVQVTPALNGKASTEPTPDVDFLVEQVRALPDWDARQRVMNAVTDTI